MDVGDPPVPGTSNLITVVSNCSTSGSSTSRLAPMPLHSTSGTPDPVPYVHPDPLTTGGDVAVFANGAHRYRQPARGYHFSIT